MWRIKLLWGTICLLFIIVIALVFILISLRIQNPQMDEIQVPLPPILENPPLEAPSKLKPAVVASIADREITIDELEQSLLKRYGSEHLDVLLNRESIEQEGISLGIIIKDAEVDLELQRMMVGYENPEVFYQSMKEQLGITKDELIEDFYYKIMLERIAIQGIRVSDQQVDAYMKAHPEEFQDYTQYRLSQIVTLSRLNAENVLKELANGVEFTKLAQELSVEEASALAGGDLGWVDSDDPFIHPLLLEAAELLSENEISPILDVGDVFIILLLKEKKEIKRSSGEQVREQVRKEIALQQSIPLKELVQKLREKWKSVIMDPSLKL